MSLAETSDARSLGRYKLIASLGQGGMANVYLAMAAGLASFNKLLVLKVLRPDAGADFVQMFLDEARLSACFNHPNIVQTYEVGEAGGLYFIALEYLDGQSLRAVQRKLGAALSLHQELRVLAAVARGLDYAHELKDFQGRPLHVVHRDISPQNVFLTYDGQVKLLDFGIAKAASSQHDTHVGLIKGKVDYIAPEQARGEQVDRRADIFSLGVMAWEAATGQRFSGGHRVADVAKLHKRLTGGEPDVHEVRPDVPESLADLIRCALSLDPAQRFATALDFADAVESFLESLQLRPSAKTLSDLLAEPYLEVRAKTTAVIHEQLQRIAVEGNGDSSLLVLSSGDGTSTHTGFAPPFRSSDSMLRPRAEEPRTSTSASIASVGLALSQPSPPRGGSLAHLPKFAVVVAAVAIATISALSVPRQQLDTTSSALATASSSATFEHPAAVGSRAEAPRASSAPFGHQGASSVRWHPDEARTPTILVDVRVSPENAHVSLDGKALSALPFHGKLKRDGLEHSVQASAPGYVTKTMIVPFDGDRELSVVLQRATTAPSVRAHTPSRPAPHPERKQEVDHSERPDNVYTPPRPTVARPPSLDPGVPLAPRRRNDLPLDLTNPYEN
jgi:serine/threonine protein kinase